ncbi:MAG: JAB domain-containing protein [Acidimicrobiia bacterium]
MEDALARLRGPDDVARFIARCVQDDTSVDPALIVLGIDRECWIVGGAVNNDRVSHNLLNPRELVQLRDEIDAEALVLVEIRGGEPTAPELVEADQFRIFADACESAGVMLLDCLVVCRHHWWSLRELLPRSDDFGIRGCNGRDWGV